MSEDDVKGRQEDGKPIFEMSGGLSMTTLPSNGPSRRKLRLNIIIPPCTSVPVILRKE